MSENPGKRRQSGRMVALAAACVSGLLALGTGAVALVGDRIGGEAADRSLARVDAQRLSMDVDFPGGSCDTGGTFGYGSEDDLTQWGLDNDAISHAIANTGRMRDSGVVRLHLHCPRRRTSWPLTYAISKSW